MTRQQKGKSSNLKSYTELAPIEDESPSIPSDIKHIKIEVVGYYNISPIYTISDLMVEARYADIDLGISSKTSVVHDDYIPARHEFIIECDINSTKELDKLISHPVVFLLTEHPGDVEASLLFRSEERSVPTFSPEIVPLSTESAAGIREYLTGMTVDGTAFTLSDESEKKSTPKEAGTKGNKLNLNKNDRKDKNGKAPNDGSLEKSKKDEPIIIEPRLVGCANLDLLPLLLGQREICESLIFRQIDRHADDPKIAFDMLPRMGVHVTIEEDEWLQNFENANVFSLTIESIYNIPSVMNSEMQYIIGTVLPVSPSKWKPVVIKGGTFREKNDTNPFKLWPGMSYDDSMTRITNYRIDDRVETIKNKSNVNLEVLKSTEPTVQWNTLKRTYLNNETTLEFYGKLKKYRRVPLEIYVTSVKEETSEATDDSETKSKSEGRSKKNDKDKKVRGADKNKEVENFLHLLASVDVSNLLYPGVKKCRIACPLNTYQEVEAFEQAGLESSYFVPKVVQQIVSPIKRGTEQKKEDAKKVSKGSKSGKSWKSGKSDKDVMNANKNDLKLLLPPPPPAPIEPSTPVYNEKGERTFIVVEIELTKPLVTKRELGDLSEDLMQLLPPKPQIPKIVVSSQLADYYFKDLVRELIVDVSRQYRNYLKEKEQRECKYIISEGTGMPTIFFNYLQQSGVYQSYLMSITKGVAVIANNSFFIPGDTNRNNKEYQNLVANVYTFLVKQINAVVNEVADSGIEENSIGPSPKLEPHLLYAREATEIGAIDLANRYYLERISQNVEDANCWFDYAVFQEEIGHKEKAIQCLLESLSIDSNHRYSLLMYGLCLAQKKSYEEAETCLLNMILRNYQWVEGWGAIFLFYVDINNTEGADLSMEMAKKYLNNPQLRTDYFKNVDDLAWTLSICPNTILLRTATLLLKLRIFPYAAKALHYEKAQHLGICHYYFAVILYYLRRYESALDHLAKAEDLYGPGYAVSSLAGHCYLAFGKLEEARTYYLQVLESYDRPEDVHLVSLCLALIWEQQSDPQSARKLLLIVSKFSPTPYTWLSTGILYFRQNDLISAEQCLMRANLCDSRLSDIWGYLTLINLKKQCYAEAELCYEQAKRNNIEDEDLIKKIESARMIIK